MSIEIEVLKPEVVANEIKTVVQKSGLAEDSALSLRGQFADFYNSIVEWREKAAMVTKPEDATHQKLAREVRLGLRRVRCDVENARKALKADSLARGKAIDGFANVLKYLCEPVEEKLAEVEQYAERQEAARVAAIVEDRTRALVELEADPSAYNLGAMDDETWVLVLSAAAENRRNRIEAERKAEAERIAREQADRIAREKAEAEAAAARAEAERERKAREAAEAKAKAEREKAEANARKAREAAEAQARAEKAKADAKLKAEREAREKAEREAAEAKRKEQARIDAEKAAEAARAKAEAEAKRKAAAAPDREKIMAFAAQVRNLVVPDMSTDAAQDIRDNVAAKCGQFAEWIEKQAEAL
jgi:hypothetical protein